MSLDDVARVTKIQPRILERLEAGKLDGLPADVFVRGFVRSFARCVGLEEAEALRRYAACGLSAQAPALQHGQGTGVPAVLGAASSPEIAAPAADAATEASEVPTARALVDSRSDARGGDGFAGGAGAVSELVAASASAARPALPIEVIDLAAGSLGDLPVAGAVEAAAAAAATGEVDGPTTTTVVPDPVTQTVEAERGLASAVLAVPGAGAAQPSGKRKRRRKNRDKRGAAVLTTGAHRVSDVAPLGAREPGRADDAPEAAASMQSAASGARPATPRILAAGTSPGASPRSPSLVSPGVSFASTSTSTSPSLAAPASMVLGGVAAPAGDQGRSAAPRTATGTAPGNAYSGDQSPATPASGGGIEAWSPRPVAASPSVPWRRPAYAAAVSGALVPSLVIDDADPDSAERVIEARSESHAQRRTFLPPILLDREDRSTRQGGLTLAVIILLIAATLTLSYLMRRPSASGDGMTWLATPASVAG